MFTGEIIRARYARCIENARQIARRIVTAGLETLVFTLATVCASVCVCKCVHGVSSGRGRRLTT